MPEKWRIVALVFISFPIVLHQLTSYSKDMYHLSLGFLLISYLIAWYQREKPFTYKELFSYAGLLVVFILTRPQYIPFVLILFLLRSKNENISNIFLLKRLGLAAAVIGLTGFILLISSKLGIYTSSQILTEPYEVQQYVFPDLQLLYILDNPLRFLQIIVNTLDEKFYSYYLKETIAVLGSNDTFLPDIIYITYIGILAYLVFALRRIVRAFQRIDIILLSIISVATGLLVFIMMYLYGTPVSADSIGYVQGRYFTMLLPFIIIVSTYIIDRTKQYLPFVFISFTIISVIWASFDRFFNTYDYYYSAAPESVKSAFKISKGNKDHLAIKQIHHLQLDSSRKTRGLTFFVSEREEYKPENFKAQKPFTLHVYERSCRILHQSKVINMQEIKQGWNDVILDKIITGQDKICIQISGMDRDEKNYGEIRVLKDNEKQQVLYPLYLY